MLREIILELCFIFSSWDASSDEQLMEAFRVYGNNWVQSMFLFFKFFKTGWMFFSVHPLFCKNIYFSHLVANHLGDRTADQCMNRWEKTLNPAIKRGKWDEEEDSVYLLFFIIFFCSFLC